MPAVPAVAQIGPGEYEVGIDVASGKYKTPGAEDSDVPLCYWDVMKGEDYLDQGISDKTNAQGIVNPEGWPDLQHLWMQGMGQERLSLLSVQHHFYCR